VWLHDLLKWMQTQPPVDASLDRKVLTRTVKELHSEKLIQMVTCSVPVSVDRKKDLIALFPMGTSLRSPAAQQFISAAAFKRREVVESKLPLHDVAVEHIPGVNVSRGPKPLAALARARRYVYGDYRVIDSHEHHRNEPSVSVLLLSRTPSSLQLSFPALPPGWNTVSSNRELLAPRLCIRTCGAYIRPSRAVAFRLRQFYET
jgi:hypothetical protein